MSRDRDVERVSKEESVMGKRSTVSEKMGERE